MSRIEMGGSLPPAQAIQAVERGFVPACQAEQSALILTDLPLGDRIPLRRENVGRDSLNTAGHEFNHALTALRMGVGIKKIDLRQRGSILGSTEFSGFMNDRQFQIIAAAGRVNPALGGSASGFGSDMNKVNYISFFGGLSTGDSVEQAKQAIQGVDEKVRRYATEMIAYLGGEITGADLNLILKRAYIEAGLETDGLLKELIRPKEDHDKSTIINTLSDGSYEIRYRVNGIEWSEGIVCPVCLGLNTHSPQCDFVKNKEGVRIEAKYVHRDIKKEMERLTGINPLITTDEAEISGRRGPSKSGSVFENNTGAKKGEVIFPEAV